jgi:hypothetical protein
VLMGLCALGPAEGVSGIQELNLGSLDAHRRFKAIGAKIVMFKGILAWILED